MFNKFPPENRPSLNLFKRAEKKKKMSCKFANVSNVKKLTVCVPEMQFTHICGYSEQEFLDL